MSQFTDFYQIIADSPISYWLNTLPAQLSNWEEQIFSCRYSKSNQWLNAVERLPMLIPSYLDLLNGVRAGCDPPLSTDQQVKIEYLLRQLMPWRKGPFSLYGVNIDAEWRSDWKWKRVRPHIKPLCGRLILDVGCGNGYHLWRMVGAGAWLAIGIDPMQLFYYQFSAVRKLLNIDQRAHLLPIGIEQLPALAAFDTVFSMGVLYHRRVPLDHLLQLKNQLVSGGELVLETIVIKGDRRQVLVPYKRYAQMRNVYLIPSITTLVGWLEECGFINVRYVDITATSIKEQRSTSWMTGESLMDFLQPTNQKLTIEGYPAPIRAIIVAEKN